MSESTVFQLERLYFGVLVADQGRISATPGVIARTPHVTSEQVAECLQVAKLKPPSKHETTDEMPGALGLFRGTTVDFILAKAQLNDAGLAQALFILMPVAPLRQLEGNVMALRSLAMMEMPSFEAVKRNLVPYELRNVTAPTEEDQTTALLDLILYCQDSFKTLEGILAALVQGWPIAIINSPPSVDKRLRFVQGLLSLLPVPARIGITFATHVHDPQTCQTQIKFLSEPISPPEHMVFDWAQGTLLTLPPDDSYSHFMVAQLRLDPSLVIAQTAELSRTAVWRARHKENLGRALAWVSRRGAIDRTVLEGQPADREVVAAILREDPTLSDDLRQAYARHLLAFALALDEPFSADVIPTVCVSNPSVAKAVIEQISAAMENKQAWTVYSLLERWLLRIPEASALGWHSLLHTAAKHHLSELLEQNNVQQAFEFIEYIQNTQPVLRFSEVMYGLAKIAFPHAQTDHELAHKLFLIAVEEFSAGELFRLLGNEQLKKQLPSELQEALTYLQPEARLPANPHALDQASRVFGDGHRMQVLARLVEWAMYLNRPELVDTAALQALLVMVQSSRAQDYEALIQHVVDDFSQVSIIQVLQPPGPRVLVQLLLHIGQYDQAVGLLEFYQNTVFGLDRLEDFTKLAEEIFLMSALTAEDLTDALGYLEGSQIRPEPRAMIYCGALMNREWIADQEYAARRLTTMIFNDNNLITVVKAESVLKLLEFHSRSRSAIDALRVAAALIDHTVNQGADGALLIIRMWSFITWDPDITNAALELLRRFLRVAPAREVPNLLAYFEDEMGTSIAEMLRATRLMRQVMGTNDLLTFAEEARITAELLKDVATTYHTDKELPNDRRLRRDLDTMTGGLTEQERRQVAENTHDIAHYTFNLGRDRLRKRGRQANDMPVIQGKTMPQSGVELLLFIGGHFANAQSIKPELESEAMAHIFGNRSAAMFLRETNASTRLLGGLHAAFPPETSYQISPEALKAELDSLWNSLSLYNQRRVQQSFSRACQELAQVITVMAENTVERVLGSSGIGRQLEIGQRQPRNALEAFRWIHGYFARKHTR